MNANTHIPSVSVTYASDGSSTRSNELGMRPMQERAYQKRGEQYLLIKSPPASGKSRALMFIALDKLENQGLKQAIVVVPDDETLGRENLHQINALEAVIKSVGDFDEYHSHEIENLIWGQEKYLEENTYSTGHQMVNVYQRPERRYEVRSDDAAVDVQIHEDRS